MLMNYS